MTPFELVVRDNLLRYWNFNGDNDLVEMLVLSYQEKIALAKKKSAFARDVAAHIANTEKVAPIKPLDFKVEPVEVMVA